MSSVKIQGSATGTANFTIAVPDGTSTDRTINLPDAAGSFVLADASGDVAVNGGITGVTSINGGQLGGTRNLIINGAMTVAQRGTSTSSTTSGYRGGPDRCYFNHDNYGTVTISQDTNAPKGFSKSMKVACTTADASPAAGDNLIFIHFIEAQDLQHLNYGSSDAVSTTVSFWVKTNTTGTHNFTLFTQDGTVQTIHFEYTVNAADTWEYKSFVIPANTSATINDDTGRGLQLEWFLGGGSDFTGGTADETWGSVANNKRNTSGRTLCSSTSNYWQITGIQFEVGEATPFEHESYGTTLQKCMRYYEKSVRGGFSALAIVSAAGTNREAPLQWLVRKRASPTVTFDKTSVVYYLFSISTGDSPSTIVAANAGVDGCLSIGTGMTSRTKGDTCAFDYLKYEADAEL